MDIKLTETDIEALCILREYGMLIENIPEKQYIDSIGNTIPGLRTYKKLEKLGLVLFEEDDPDDIFRPYISLTREGFKIIMAR